MKWRVNLLSSLLLLSSLTVGSAWAQIGSSRIMVERYVPRDSSKVMWCMGAGIGLPYGFMGGSFGIGTKLLTGHIGVGMVPLAWEPVTSASAVVHFRDRWAPVRPKFTITYSTAAAAIILVDNSFGADPFDTLYEEVFPGTAVYGGLEWRVIRTAPLCLDLNIGWIFPNGGTRKIEERYRQVTDDLIAQGYVLQDENISLDGPKISIGFYYSPGRSQKRVYQQKIRDESPPERVFDPDSDGDGIPDSRDQEPNTPPGAEVDYYGRTRDDDGDGVPNGIDREPRTRPGMLVDQFGVSIDADHDGVTDSLDDCPNTPADYRVDEHGCPKIVDMFLKLGRILEHIQFETGQATLLPEARLRLETIGAVVDSLPSTLHIEVHGHTDDVGSNAYNQRLSDARAQAVIDFLLETYPDLSSDQFTPRGFGKSQPLVTGMDDESRAQNRRVEFVVTNREVLQVPETR